MWAMTGRVEANRARLQQVAGIPGILNWLNQVHGIAVHPVSDRYGAYRMPMPPVRVRRGRPAS
jgi:copper oxidase (laccase) domain-containing protein